MGGSKKKSLAQMEKQQDQQDTGKKPEPGKKDKGKGKTVAEKRTPGISLPNFDDPKFVGDLSKLGALTPYSIASQFNVRLSVARDILEELERRRIVKSAGGNTRIKIYRLAAA